MCWGAESTLGAPKMSEKGRRSCSMHGSVLKYNSNLIAPKSLSVIKTHEDGLATHPNVDDGKQCHAVETKVSSHNRSVTGSIQYTGGITVHLTPLPHHI